jgi:hypothetical protein
MRKHLKYGAIVGALAAPVAAAAVVAAVPAASATSGDGASSAAFGISATGLLNIPQTPAVTSASRRNTRSVASLPGTPLVRLSLLRTSAVPGHSEASVADLKIAKAAISPKAVLSAKLITAKCDDGAGSSRLVDVRLAGRSIQAGGSPNSTLTVPVEGLGGVQVTVNKQVRNPDGSVTITGLELAVQALGKSQTIDISSATCAGQAPGEAPKPVPVPSDLPVTG